MLHRIGESDRAYEMLETLLDEEAKYGETATITDQGQVFFQSIINIPGFRTVNLSLSSWNWKKDKLIIHYFMQG